MWIIALFIIWFELIGYWYLKARHLKNSLIFLDFINTSNIPTIKFAGDIGLSSETYLNNNGFSSLIKYSLFLSLILSKESAYLPNKCFQN